MIYYLYFKQFIILSIARKHHITFICSHWRTLASALCKQSNCLRRFDNPIRLSRLRSRSSHRYFRSLLDLGVPYAPEEAWRPAVTNIPIGRTSPTATTRTATTKGQLVATFEWHWRRRLVGQVAKEEFASQDEWEKSARWAFWYQVDQAVVLGSTKRAVLCRRGWDHVR